MIQQLQPGRVIVALDQEQNPNTDRARERWLHALYAAGLPTYQGVWEGADVGGPKGLDDLYAAGGRPRIRAANMLPPEIGHARRPRPIMEEGPVDQGTNVAYAKALTSAAVHDFIIHAARNKGKAQLVRTSPGTGKTTAVGHALPKGRAKARVFVGTRTLAHELAETFGYTFIEGRSEDNCQRIDVVHALGEGGHDVGRLACGTPAEPRCPFLQSCPYWQQYHQPGTWVGAAEQVFNPKFLQGARLIIVDDADLTRSLVERHRLDYEVLRGAIDQLQSDRWEGARRVLTFASHAVVDAPRRDSGHSGPALLGGALWDHLVKIGRRYGADLPALIAALPHGLMVPEPQGDVHGVLTVDAVQAVPPAVVVRVLTALTEELPAFLTGEAHNSRLRLDAHGIDVWRLKPHPTDRKQVPLLRDKAILVLDATPVEPLVDYLIQYHQRLPDVSASVKLPENVTVVQYASSSNGHAALREQKRYDQVASEITEERARFPVPRSEDEAAICFVAHREGITKLGFADSQVLTFGSARGSNALRHVERLHVIGRPMPPGDELVFLAQVLHHDESAISA